MFHRQNSRLPAPNLCYSDSALPAAVPMSTRHDTGHDTGYVPDSSVRKRILHRRHRKNFAGRPKFLQIAKITTNLIMCFQVTN